MNRKAAGSDENFFLPRIPVSTYRMQFNPGFGFSAARAVIPYLYALGISDLYASPYLKAKEGSAHGYDVVDHHALNPEIGSEKEYDLMTAELDKYGMGQLLDIVPNHMCIDSSDNSWWMDVLENGPSSGYASFFDIDWEPVKRELKDKVLLPILGGQYGEVLENGDLRLAFEEGAFFVHYYERKFPIRPHSSIIVLEYRLGELENVLAGNSPAMTELLSIITAIRHLPNYTEEEPEKIVERQREKEVTRRRLRSLYSGSEEIRCFIDENVRLLNGVKGEPSSFDLLDRLLSEQIYRLAHWRVATEEINYRRFFDVNSLGAIRVENPAVFMETHGLIMKLIRQGRVTGLRVDHPDGLFNPSDYLRMLQASCFVQLRLAHREALRKEIPASRRPTDADAEVSRLYEEALASDPQYKPFYIVGEKILLKGERMPEEWPIFSTTGYVFLNSLNGVFVDSGNARAFSEIYSRFIRGKTDFHGVVYEKKKLVMQVAMASEINTLGHYLNNISEGNRHTRDFTLNSLTRAIIEVIAFFPVYRTYINSFEVRDRDRQQIESAVAKAVRKNPAIPESIFDFLKDVLLLRLPVNSPETEKVRWLDFVMRFQQITGPVMAKGVEDTAFYVYNRLVSLNEVGGMPERFGTPLETFHGQNIERSKYWPHALIGSSTHDTKRSEDVRARINVLSELPDSWKRHLALWTRLNRKKIVMVDGQPAPDRNEEYLFYQTLLGAWPIDVEDAADEPGFIGRIKDYMLKAIREAKINTSWINPYAIYEEAVMIFIDRVLAPGADNAFLKEFIPFQKRVSHYGLFNSLSQTLLKIASPGVPDFYQGTEIWNFSLVDPDNRRAVDFEKLDGMLKEIMRRQREVGPMRLSRDLTVGMKNGMMKLYLVHKALNFRREHRALFDSGEYLAIETMGEKAENVCALARRLMDATVIVVVPRFLTDIVPGADFLPYGPEAWGNSYVTVPGAEAGDRYRNIFTDEYVVVGKNDGSPALYLREVFDGPPFALLERTGGR